jgi:hypothetical protein
MGRRAIASISMPPSDRVYPPPKKWDVVPWNQWSQTYYELRDGKLYLCHNDNKDQHYSEDEVDIAGFLARHAGSTDEPYPEIVAFIEAERERTSGEPIDWSRVWEWPGNTDFFNERYAATASAKGLSYVCEIDGPFCGCDSAGSQSWEEFEAEGPPNRIQMPASIADEIRAHLGARRKNVPRSSPKR